MTFSKAVDEQARLILEAIQVLHRSGQNEAAIMMTYVGIDQMAWISHAKEVTGGGEFKEWVNKYLKPQALVHSDCTADDLWGARCGLIHTGAPESRDYRNAVAKRLYYSFGAVLAPPQAEDDGLIIDGAKLIQVFVAGVFAYMHDVAADEAAATRAEEKARRLMYFRTAS